MKRIRTTLAPLILGALLAHSASAQVGEGPGRPQGGTTGKKSSVPEQILSMFDRNGDGVLDEQECAAARKAIMERRGQGATGPGDGERRRSEQPRGGAGRSDSQARSDQGRSDQTRRDQARHDQARRKGASKERTGRDRTGRAPSRMSSTRQRQAPRGRRRGPEPTRQRGQNQKRSKGWRNRR